MQYSITFCLCSAVRALYLLHRHCLCCTGTVSPAQALCSAAQALYLLHRHCSKNMFKKAVHRISSKKIFSASLYSVWLGSVHSTPCMYMHGFTLVYIYIYIYSIRGSRKVRKVRALRVLRRPALQRALGGGDVRVCAQVRTSISIQCRNRRSRKFGTLEVSRRSAAHVISSTADRLDSNPLDRCRKP